LNKSREAFLNGLLVLAYPGKDHGVGLPRHRPSMRMKNLDLFGDAIAAIWWIGW